MARIRVPSIHSLFEEFQRVQDIIEDTDEEESVRHKVETKYYATLSKIEGILYQ